MQVLLWVQGSRGTVRGILRCLSQSAVGSKLCIQYCAVISILFCLNLPLPELMKTELAEWDYCRIHKNGDNILNSLYKYQIAVSFLF